MRTFLKILAILALIVTIAAAGAVLYALETRFPEVQVVYAKHEPAEDNRDHFDVFAAALAESTYGGRIFTEETVLDEKECNFLQCTLRLTNRCLFPMEWIQVELEPGEADILESRDENAHVLGAGASGDMSLEFLTGCNTFPVERTVKVIYYLIGRPMEKTVQVIWD